MFRAPNQQAHHVALGTFTGTAASGCHGSCTVPHLRHLLWQAGSAGSSTGNMSGWPCGCRLVHCRCCGAASAKMCTNSSAGRTSSSADSSGLVQARGSKMALSQCVRDVLLGLQARHGRQGWENVARCLDWRHASCLMLSPSHKEGLLALRLTVALADVQCAGHLAWSERDAPATALPCCCGTPQGSACELGAAGASNNDEVLTN